MFQFNGYYDQISMKFWSTFANLGRLTYLSTYISILENFIRLERESIDGFQSVERQHEVTINIGFIFLI
jgi:hypothetical protein